MRKFYVLISIVTLLVSTGSASSINFNQCLATVNNMTLEGKTDNHGRTISPRATNATAITYDLCVSACGSGTEAFQWSSFTQQFSSWVLPWLALVSQLPFGANDRLDNFESMLLTVGSPALAAYSLALTVLNERWVTRLFSGYRYPNAAHAVRVLINLQQAPIRINTEDTRLASLVVLPQNDNWWKELVAWLDYTQSWSISVAMSIVWVVIAYVFTLVDYFSQNALSSFTLSAVGEGGGSIASLWLGLLPIVTGWLQVSPKCDSKRLMQALDRANGIAFVATESSSPCKAHCVSGEFALRIQTSEENPARRDEYSTPPVYNYARFLPWVQVVTIVSDTFRNTSERSRRRGQATQDLDQKRPFRSTLATISEVEECCSPLPELEYRVDAKRHYGLHSSVLARMFIASVWALVLQWGTTGSAVIVIWFTPTIGLGCRSAAYLSYGVASTVVWLMLLTSSILAYYSTIEHSHIRQGRRFRSAKAGISRVLSIFLRRTGKILASLNALWIIAIGMLQFSNMFENCYCNSSVLGLGEKAYDVILLTVNDVGSMRGAWIGGFSLSAVTVVVFVGFVTIFVHPKLPPEGEYL
ncbi:hypothetical protein CVT26_009691 [Gymnopilus dilepis]|uniref:Solute carrier family 40 protein n=1 Tax=Gymnopilus dilepis TaxID=231916 RepID=A0A409YBL5_9AGAR|nr:hypothetical protein CVT26_009691 [Gymnopilus dilepis]